MSDIIKDEAKVGAMLRYMTGDVALGLKNELVNLYRNNDGSLDEVGKECAKWHWLLVKYSRDPVSARKYLSIIEYAFEYGIFLGSMKSWKKMMRITLPEEFIYKIAGFTQVPQIAVMDDTHAEARRNFVDEMRDASEIQW